MRAELFDVYRQTDGRTDSHHEANTPFSEICLVPDIVHSAFYYMEQSPSWEANRFLASQKTPLIL